MSSIIEIISNFFDTADFMPRWVCGKWTDFHGWLYILSNLAIFAAYFTIPVLLFKFIKNRNEPFLNRVLFWFILFILFCGSSHLIDALIFWIPAYRLNALVLFITALISWLTVLVLFKFLPIAANYKSPVELQQIIDAQTKALSLANLKISESEHRFKTLVNNNPDIITMINKDLKYEFVNDAILKVRNLKITDIIGNPISEVVGKGDSTINNLFANQVKKTFDTQQPQTFEFSTYTNRTNNSFFSLTVFPLENEVTKVVDNVLTITKDITIQKLQEQNLKESIINLEMLATRLEKKRKILEDFTYIVSHNLRSPVANLASLIGLIKEEEEQETKDLFFEKIVTAFDVLSSTVNDLTEVVQIRQNTEIPKEVLSFQSILQDHLISLESQITATNAEISFDFSECENLEYPKIYLESIFLNLLTNAIKYRHPERNPKIKFYSKVDANGIITLTCEDNGLGIDLKKNGHKLFGLKKTFHGQADSRGVGLFITKNQIETMGGQISAQSEVNVGTKFIIQFNSYLNLWSEK